MNMQIQGRNSYFFIPVIALLIFSVEQFFFLTQSLDHRIVYVALSLFLFAVYGKGRNKIFAKLVFYAFLVTLFSSLHAIAIGYVPLHTGLKNELFISMILIYFPLSELVKKKHVRNVENTIIIVAIFLSFVLLGLTIGSVQLIDDVTSEREDSVRAIIGPTLLSWAILIITNRILFKIKQPLAYKLFLVIFWAVLIFVVQTRSQTMSLLAVFCVMILMRYYSNIKKKKSFGIYLIVLCAFLFVYYIAGYVTHEINDSISKEEASSVMRLGAYGYYFELFLQNPLFGIGPTEAELNIASVNGILMKWYDADIGLVGVLAKYGIFAVIIICVFVVKLFRICKKEERFLYSSIGLQMLLLLPFNCPLNSPETTFYFALYISIIDVLKSDWNGQNYSLDSSVKSRRV